MKEIFGIGSEPGKQDVLLLLRRMVRNAALNPKIVELPADNFEATHSSRIDRQPRSPGRITRAEVVAQNTTERRLQNKSEETPVENGAKKLVVSIDSKIDRDVTPKNSSSVPGHKLSRLASHLHASFDRDAVLPVSGFDVWGEATPTSFHPETEKVLFRGVLGLSRSLSYGFIARLQQQENRMKPAY